MHNTAVGGSVVDSKQMVDDKSSHKLWLVHINTCDKEFYIYDHC